MSTPPPIEWFPGINFNVAFYTAGGEYATIDYCNQNFLKSVGYAVSRALSTTFNNIVYFNGGFQVIGDITATGTIYANDANITNTILCTNVSASSISATNFTGSGAGLTNIDGSVIKTGIVEVNVGGTGKNTLTTTQILVGNNTDPIIQSSNLTWDNSNDIFTASNVAGNGSRLSNLNASNVSDGTLAVTRGGTGASNFTAGRLLIGNDTSAITNNGNLTWNGTTNTLNVTGTGTATTLSATNIGIGITNPTSSLEIIKTTTAATSDLIMMKRDDKNHLRISQIYIGINDIKQIFYQMNNNVEDPVLTFYKNSIGIGTTAPGLFKLDVGGTARASILTTPNSVGIGITNPTTTSLHIVNTVNTFKDVIAMNYNDINGLKIQQAYEGVNDIKYTFYEKRNNAEVDTITIYKGAVGIGTTTPATFADLDVIGTTRSTTLTTNGIGIGITDPTTNLLDIVSPVTTSNDLINLRYDNSNGLKIQQNYVAVNDFKQSFIQRNSGVNTNILTFYKGNIGIGTTTPALSDKLSITGNTKITGTATIDTNLIVGGSAGIVGTSQFTGNMGIGTTASSDANTKLVVSGDINIIGNNRYRIGGNAIGNWLAGTDTTKIYYNVGNVGIGTTDPQQKLDIRGINPTIKLLDTGADGNAIIQFRELNDLYGMDIAYIGNTDNRMYIRSYNNSATPVNNITIDRGSGNVGIGNTNPAYKLHVRCGYNNVATGLHLDASESDADINKYALTIWPYVIAGGEVGWRFRTQNFTGGTHTPLTLTNYGNVVIAGNLNCANINCNNSYVLGTEVYARNNYDTRIRSDSGGMYLEMGYIGSAGGLLKLGAYNSNTEINSGENRNIRMTTGGSVWIYTPYSGSFNAAGSIYWTNPSDHRIKENIKKANLKICYNNIKNINLYRFNYIDGYKKATQYDKTQLGFIAQQVKQHYPKSIRREKMRFEDKREVPDLSVIDVAQVNYSLFGAVKQLIRVVEKQSKRIKKLEEMLNIIDDDEVEDDADEPYIKIECDEVDIDEIEPSEPTDV